ncbi:MAG: hypothetical protein WC873_04360 [Candidatus Gracilibacteria bacterium]
MSDKLTVLALKLSKKLLDSATENLAKQKMLLRKVKELKQKIHDFEEIKGLNLN